MLANKLKFIGPFNTLERRLVGLIQYVLRATATDGSADRFAAHPEHATELSNTSQGTKYHRVSPGRVSSMRVIPDDIVKPDYVSGSRLSKAIRERVSRRRPAIEIKSDKQIQGMRDTCR
jgi:hypothetical protein